MRTLTFDFEHTEGVFRPWEEGFIISCIGYQFHDGETLINHGVIWFDHKNIDFVPPATVDSWKFFQSMVDASDVIVGHNLKHDLIIARYHGINFEGKKLWCTMVADYLINGQDTEIGYSLEEVAPRSGVADKLDLLKQYWDAKIHTYDIPHDVLHTYVSQDVSSTAGIYFCQDVATTADKVRKVIELQNEYLFSLSDMELNGLLIDQQKAREIYEEEVKIIADLEGQLKKLFGEERLNLQSNDHLSAALYGGKAVIEERRWITKTLKSKPETKYSEKSFDVEIVLPGIFKPLPKTKTKKEGYYKTDKDTIALLKSHNSMGRKVKKILHELSGHYKIAESIVGKKDDAGILNKIAKDGCAHTSFQNAFTSTGRLSSRNPNGQNLPREGTSPIKQMIVPRYDYILQVDLSQIEWRDAAWQSQDKEMIREINSGVDQHIRACVDLMELPFVNKADPESKANRNHAKIFNFRMIYGGGFWGFYLDQKMPRFSKAKWQRICSDFFVKYPDLKTWQDRNIETVIKNNGWLQIPTGRKFKFRKGKVKNGVAWYADTQIKNYPIQGNSGGNILPLLCVVIRRGIRNMGLVSKMILTVHDSIVFDVKHEELKKLLRLCEIVFKNLDKYISDYFEVDWNVRLDGECEYGRTYGSLKAVSSADIV